ncbi:restriction endonuclease subunit R [Candidatus Micrarchaeota archaeon CG11_big_fil_rev_8_21_14_0_20_47_5]|nr:MAG: restriction endonuclease subunit R [Candidatus Micrarchaeota archaeon CG1_02_47_40]PIN83992.1 MAG: restriction endonuclease subunit R [Candidatus Micrarchaeota archaeon CG11_big_fil_rev_8_21_14_0_20_47_5]
MVVAKSLGTGTTPLRLAELITKLANREWEEGAFLEKVSPTTRDLLRFWDPDGGFADTRNINFHEGQWQAILNSIYVHEILKVKGVHELYMAIYPDLLNNMDLLDLKKEKHEHPKYCVKMATGTGKTWVLSALLIWHYLNAKNEETPSGRFSKNFLLVAPGIIVYERLLDAYLGKRRDDGTRNFNESDFRRFESLFIPPAYKGEVFGFIQSCVSQKDEIGRKVTGEGLIAITNWHLLAGEEEEDEHGSPLDSPAETVKELLPITPGTTAGHSLNELDNRYLRGRELEFLARLPDLVVFNDEAHHLGEIKKSDEVFEKKWQDSLDEISKRKNTNFIQFDFSATPYSITGSGQKRTRHFFPHIIVNFELITAIQNGLVKTVAIDKRKELAAIPLDALGFKAEKDGKTTVLSDGQRTMLRAGLSRLKILDDGFAGTDKTKHPKMLVVCEDTTVVPLVHQFLMHEGLSKEEITEIHSNRKGEIGQEEWERVKQQLFSIDRNINPKVIISVLMLREGFDVNNICVIVPLRATSSYILLEQTIGRGLRLMWREPEYEDSKRDTRERLLIKKEEPINSMDILYIIEHPAFVEFYETELSGAIGTTKELPTKDHVVGDIINVTLKANFKDYDFYWPIIVHDQEEHLTSDALAVEKLEPFPIKLSELKPLVNRDGDVFYAEELTVKTKFGEYSVTADIFTAKSYNSFLEKIVNAVSSVPVKIGKRAQKNFPVMQINSAVIAKLTDDYIRHRLFEEEFDPMAGNNWRILILTQARIIQHIIRNLSQVIYDLQKRLRVVDATILKRHFSGITEIKIRETYAIDVAKIIYPKIAYPSNKGGFEKAFIEFIDSDSKVKAFIKINEHYCNFANILYIREDGMLAHYFPDFMVKIADKFYLVETKAERDMNNTNVKQKRLATLDWIGKVNELKPEDRMNCTWYYVLLGERTFYDFSNKEATTEEVLQYALMTKDKVESRLTGFMEQDS